MKQFNIPIILIKMCKTWQGQIFVSLLKVQLTLFTMALAFYYFLNIEILKELDGWESVCSSLLFDQLILTDIIMDEYDMLWNIMSKTVPTLPLKPKLLFLVIANSLVRRCFTILLVFFLIIQRFLNYSIDSFGPKRDYHWQLTCCFSLLIIFPLSKGKAPVCSRFCVCSYDRKCRYFKPGLRKLWYIFNVGNLKITVSTQKKKQQTLIVLLIRPI